MTTSKFIYTFQWPLHGLRSYGTLEGWVTREQWKLAQITVLMFALQKNIKLFFVPFKPYCGSSAPSCAGYWCHTSWPAPGVLAPSRSSRTGLRVCPSVGKTQTNSTQKKLHLVDNCGDLKTTGRSSSQDRLQDLIQRTEHILVILRPKEGRNIYLFCDNISQVLKGPCHGNFYSSIICSFGCWFRCHSWKIRRVNIYLVNWYI